MNKTSSSKPLFKESAGTPDSPSAIRSPQKSHKRKKQNGKQISSQSSAPSDYLEQQILERIRPQNRDRNQKQLLDEIREVRQTTLMDDLLFRCFFKDRPDLVQKVLRILVGRNDLVLEKSETQYDLPRSDGGRRLILDLYGRDLKGNIYNLEIQQEKFKTIPKRLRYHASMLNVNHLNAGDDFLQLANVYTIVIMESDPYQRGLGRYEIEQKINGTDLIFNDGNHIILINGQYRKDNPLGRLLHDFHCAQASEMYDPDLAKRMKELKESQEGVTNMLSMSQRIRMEGVQEGMQKGRQEERQKLHKEFVENLLQRTDFSMEEIARLASCPLKTVKKIKAEMEENFKN